MNRKFVKASSTAKFLKFKKTKIKIGTKVMSGKMMLQVIFFIFAFGILKFRATAPVLISTCSDFCLINTSSSAGSFLVTKDIDCVATPTSAPGVIFSGVFNGGNHTISNLKTYFFGQTTNAVIQNIFFSGVSACNGINLGFLVYGVATDTLISNVHIIGNTSVTNKVI